MFSKIKIIKGIFYCELGGIIIADINCTSSLGELICGVEKNTPHKDDGNIKILAADVALSKDNTFNVIICPKCNSLMIVIKDKKRATKYKCVNCGSKIRLTK